MASDRNIRRVLNMKQDSVHVDDRASISGLSEGQVSFSKSNNKQLAVTRKRNGKIWKSYMSHNGDQYVDRDIHVARRGYFANAVGIGTTSPSKELDVDGDISLEAGSGDYYSNDGSQGWTGTFTNGDSDIVTVKNGIITDVS